jgi:hypothetical protein
MTKPTDANTYVTPTSDFVPVDWVPITPSGTDLARPFRAIRANADCTITVLMPGSTTPRVMPFLAGETRLGMFTRVTAISAGTAEGAV